MAQPPQSYIKISIAQPCKKRKGKGRQNGGEAQPRRRRALIKPTTAKIAPIKKKSDAIFASCGGFAEPYGIVKSSRKVASPKACKSPLATVFDDQRSAKTPWRQILPPAKFPRRRLKRGRRAARGAFARHVPSGLRADRGETAQTPAPGGGVLTGGGYVLS